MSISWHLIAEYFRGAHQKPYEYCRKHDRLFCGSFSDCMPQFRQCLCPERSVFRQSLLFFEAQSTLLAALSRATPSHSAPKIAGLAAHEDPLSFQPVQSFAHHTQVSKRSTAKMLGHQ